METANQHLNVVATLVLGPGPEGFDDAALRRRVAARVPLVEPMRRRLYLPPIGDALWVDDPDLFLDAHLHHVRLDPRDSDALGRLTGEIASKPLPRDRPLWEIWYADGLPDGCVAVIAKVHHCAMDGISGFGALAAFFDLERGVADDASAAALAEQGRAAPAPTGVADVLRSSLSQRPQAFAAGVRTLANTARAAVRTARSAGPAPGLPLTAPRVPLSGALTPHRDVRFADVALDDVRLVRKVFGVTVNDVVVAICTGALRRHLQRCDALPDGPMVAAVPTSERTPEHGPAGNAFSAMMYRLPVHIDDVVERMVAVQESASAAKQLSQHMGPGVLAGLAGLAPPQVIAPAAQLLSSSRLADRLPLFANLLISNVRGPELPLYIGDAQLERIYPLGPLIEGAAVNMTVVSYVDHVHFGVIACPDVVADLDGLRDAITFARDELVAAAYSAG
jgi:WS/DGAT/MGAT family acyltransferase